jgi:hypothetical protein
MGLSIASRHFVEVAARSPRPSGGASIVLTISPGRGVEDFVIRQVVRQESPLRLGLARVGGKG